MKTLKIGRSSENDIVLRNNTVSSHHAILKVNEGNQTATLSDLGSTNGTFVNGKRITQEWPVDNSSILRFGQEEITLNKLLATYTSSSEQNHTRVSGHSSIPTGALTIGRGKDCKIKFTQDDVSTHHAVLYKNNVGQVIIEDQGSTNGTYVNGQRISSSVLRPGDTVTITRKYAFNWQQYFNSTPSQKENSLTRWISVAAAVVILCVGGYFAYDKLYKKKDSSSSVTEEVWNTEKIYAEYHSAVCVTYTAWGVKASIKIGGNTVDIVDLLKKLSKNNSNSATLCVLKDHAGNSIISIGEMAASGTAFFITKDGKMATNLHNTRPWLFYGTGKEMVEFIENNLREWLMNQGVSDLSGLRIIPVLTRMGIVLDGVPFKESNLIAVSEYKGHDDVNRDCAIIQTENRQLPSQVKKIIDYKQADISDEALTVGKTIFTIGYPFGPIGINTNSNQELVNQVHKGQITQDVGEYEFGHDAASAHGASGSPIINEKGRLVGITHAGTEKQGFNYAIKAKHIVDLMK